MAVINKRNLCGPFDSEHSLDRTFWRVHPWTMDTMPDPICLLRRDPSLNMARFYRVEILQDLFGQTNLQRSWGRIGGRGQSLMITYGSVDQAEHAARRLIKSKQRRGYRAPA